MLNSMVPLVCFFMIRIKLCLMTITLVSQIGFASNMYDEDLWDGQTNASELTLDDEFVWALNSQDCSSEDRSFPLTPRLSTSSIDRFLDSRAPSFTREETPQPLFSAMTYTSGGESVPWSSLNGSIALALHPTEVPRTVEQYIRALPSGMSIHIISSFSMFVC